MREGANQRPLWICPNCGQSFVTRNMSHSCVTLTEEAFFAGRDAQRALYRALRAFIERCGPAAVNINKTRISFQARARFVSINRITRDGLACHLWLKRQIESPRFHRIERFPPGDFVHNFKLTEAAQLDEEMAAWIAEAYEVGMQRWARPD
jgi:Domain of unknown function (DUF5655)